LVRRHVHVNGSCDWDWWWVRIIECARDHWRVTVVHMGVEIDELCCAALRTGAGGAWSRASPCALELNRDAGPSRAQTGAVPRAVSWPAAGTPGPPGLPHHRTGSWRFASRTSPLDWAETSRGAIQAQRIAAPESPSCSWPADAQDCQRGTGTAGPQITVIGVVETGRHRSGTTGGPGRQT
jgi:hypothetical protein